MKKCIKDYRFHGATYIKDKDYDIKEEVAKEHERYFGLKLWEKKSADKKTSDKETSDKGASKKTSKSSKKGKK